jgi:Domain of unknown function (DUF4123)
MTTWMLLEHRDDLLPALFRQMGYLDYEGLFESTELATYSEFGPLLVKDDNDGTLLELMQAAPGDWPGLVIESEHRPEALLDHLRHLLIVRFEQTRIGMLRYWSPAVAERFFPTCTDSSLWLGPISRLAWHTASEIGWQSLNNPQAGAWQSPSHDQRLTLSAEQNQALAKHLSDGQES